MSTVSDTVAANIRNLRHARNWSQRTLAERCAAAGMPSLDGPKIAKTELRLRDAISVDELVAFAAAFGVRPEELLVPFECPQCHNAPPAGFACKVCGADR
jgi:transcriptional regulator with XRE-family HTH domain